MAWKPRSARTSALRCAAAILVVGGLSSAAPASAAFPETLDLDSYQVPQAAAAGPVTTLDALADGVAYEVQVVGTVSHWTATRWLAPFKVCGTSEPDALFPSPGRPASAVGQDAEFIFANPRPASWNCPPLPEAKPAFEIDTGSGFADRDAVGAPAGPTADHRYTYLLTGEGAPASFRLLDGNTSDNYGRLRITVSEVPCSGAGCSLLPPPGGTTTTTTTTSTTAASSSGGGVSGAASSSDAPAPRACVSRRRLTIRVVTRRRDPVVSARITVDGRPATVTRRRIDGRMRLTTVIDFRGLPKRDVIVRISATTDSGRVLTGRRTYRTCSPRRAGGRPKL